MIIVLLAGPYYPNAPQVPPAPGMPLAPGMPSAPPMAPQYPGMPGGAPMQQPYPGMPTVAPMQQPYPGMPTVPPMQQPYPGSTGAYPTGPQGYGTGGPPMPAYSSGASMPQAHGNYSHNDAHTYGQPGYPKQQGYPAFLLFSVYFI